MKDDLGDRMKEYEGVEAGRRLSGTPVCARIDGRSFSKFTKGFNKPYDESVARAMKHACATLVERTHANIGFVQSDEISLVWDTPTDGSQIIFDGRVQKLTSVLASLATASFITSLATTSPGIVAQRLPHFDARVWAVPSREEAANTILWRSQDARRNGISSAAHTLIASGLLQGMNRVQMLAEMDKQYVDYHSDYPRHHRFGTYYQRCTEERHLTKNERQAIPEQHRPAFGTLVTRSAVRELDINYFGMVTNRVDLIFNGADALHKQGA